MIKIIPYFAPLCVLALSGCITPYQTNFDCPVGKGEPCTSMTKINHMIDQGILGKAEIAPQESGSNGEDSKNIRITHFKPKAEPVAIAEASRCELSQIAEPISETAGPENFIHSIGTPLEQDLPTDSFDNVELIQPDEELTC